MDREKNITGFLILLFIFITSILFLIFSPNFFFLLLGWDGLGVSSYFLVVFYKNYSRSVAGIVTFLVNRFGDIFFFSRICLFSFSLD
jgi:NADH:ubiquinone oxidoreductase subunit 5 (subunit L)/multisubunit Na+/H+ antiporter MnhA subunit